MIKDYDNNTYTDLYLMGVGTIFQAIATEKLIML